MNTMIQIQALKYGNIPHYEWETTLLEQTDSYVIVTGEYGRQLHHYTKGKVFTVNNRSIEFFSLDSWFTVSMNIMDGEVQEYYCNIAQPSQLADGKLTFVDLDLDYIRNKEGIWRVVDEDEFEVNAVRYQYPQQLIEQARMELERFRIMVERQQFPFDGKLNSYI